MSYKPQSGAETHKESHRMNSQMEVEVTVIIRCHCAVLYFMNATLQTGGSKKKRQQERELKTVRVNLNLNVKSLA